MHWAILAVPLLLFIPALHYSLDTPIGTFEASPRLADTYNSTDQFIASLRETLVGTSKTRFRPFYNYWNGLQWKIFGDLAWPHYLLRWLTFLAAVALFTATFLRISSWLPARNLSPPRTALIRFTPSALLVFTLCLSFPSVVIIRIECVELYTVFFLGLCNWAAALLLTARAKGGDGKHHALFALGYIGLVFSKEVNVAPALWLAICWWAFVVVRGLSFRKLLMGAALTLLLGFAIFRVLVALELAQKLGSYFVPTKPPLDGITENATHILQQLFQWETSKAIATVFALLLVVLAVAIASKVARRNLTGELAFILLLVGEFISMFLVLTVQYDFALRYASILIPGLATLLAFAAKFLLEAAIRRKVLADCTALGLAIFIVYLAAANYYRLLYQVVAYHSNRNVEDLLISEVAKLLNRGEYVQARANSEHAFSLNAGFYSRKYWPDAAHGSPAIKRTAPRDASQSYYLLDVLGQSGLVSLDTHAALHGRTDYGVLHWPLKAASLVQGGAPYIRLDVGTKHMTAYRWIIHAVPQGMGNHLDKLVSNGGEPLGDSFYDLYFRGDKLMYVRRPCLDSDIEDFFFLHLFPVELSELPEGRREYGFDNLDFHFHDHGVKSGDLCVAVRTLPEYGLERVDTGQYVMGTGRRIWETSLTHRDLPQAPSPAGLPLGGH